MDCYVDKNPVKLIPSKEVIIRSDKKIYMALEEANFAIMNYTDRVAYFGFCDDQLMMRFQTQYGGFWEFPDLSPVCPAPLFSKVGIAPGEMRSGFKTKFSSPGIKRLYLGVTWGQNSSVVDTIYSNAFEVKQN